jgi:outer membrane protein assembly factor BamD
MDTSSSIKLLSRIFVDQHATMKRSIRIFSTILSLLFLFSCATQQHTEKAVSIYQEAIGKYEKKDYYEARKLLEESIPLLKGKREIIHAQFCLAECYFYDKDYRKSAYYFAEFYKIYPKAQQAEEALYMQGYSMYLSGPDIRLDTTKMEKALQVLRQYKHEYPTGTYQSQVQQYIQDLEDKLSLKAFRNATLYYKLGHYQAAVKALHNFQAAYPTAAYCEKAIYIKIKAQYKWAKITMIEDPLDSWKAVIQYYNELLEQYPNSRYAPRAQAIYEQAIEKVYQLGNYQTITNH